MSNGLCDGLILQPDGDRFAQGACATGRTLHWHGMMRNTKLTHGIGAANEFGQT